MGFGQQAVALFQNYFYKKSKNLTYRTNSFEKNLSYQEIQHLNPFPTSQPQRSPNRYSLAYQIDLYLFPNIEV